MHQFQSIVVAISFDTAQVPFAIVGVLSHCHVHWP
ncbi:Uncharacterised protein [Vibrio cholerae]|nr:Uncharacterised protein [Vibrio cholerae]